ncbi:hypothetical protein M404DRAFT_1001502 [Pisolithus tinctorius Marx 270]|uniref:Uncharacterized protein n=1 Tax=Pisolithus tinctorius Marx 270 TaxID=870435 RepID=A0A0C3NQU3_PISTI|nr:hypothetical protein M404DRAFT_1007866 [Pisolithus tinctorius Marx 270]KIO03235.1 hypothetical protein M404DRAFT_1001502 [Pisolithus tinctorius Marx 270]
MKKVGNIPDKKSFDNKVDVVAKDAEQKGPAADSNEFDMDSTATTARDGAACN